MHWPHDRLRRSLLASVAAIALGALVGIGLLWPRGEAPDLGRQPNTFVDATITEVETTQCAAIEATALTGCQLALVRLTSGPDRGEAGEFIVRDIDFGVPTVKVGDKVVLLDVDTSQPPYRYTFSDFQRSAPMWWLVAAFVVVVLAFGRRQGLRALIGLVASAVVLVAFIVPAILRDEQAILVALTGTVMIAFVALYLAHGFNIATTVALAGTLASLAVTALLAVAAVSITHLTGLADEQAQVLRITATAVDLRGLLIAGIVVGALGVLDDVTVTQVSTVGALRRARPDLSRLELYRDAVSVGRDHVASTVNTLVLAYAGAALPLLILFEQGSKPFGRIITSEVIAVEVVRMLVGSIGLVLSVPITTALAAAVMTVDDPEGHHGHSHPSPRRSAIHDADRASSTATHGPRVAEQSDEDVPPRWEDFAPRDDLW